MANVARYDDLNTGAIAYATLVSCILLLITILLVRALCCAWVEGEEARKTDNAHYVTADAEIGEQKARLDGYWTKAVEVPPADDTVDAEPTQETRVLIPLERARELLLKELAPSA